MVDTKATTIDREKVRSEITRALVGQSESPTPA